MSLLLVQQYIQRNGFIQGRQWLQPPLCATVTLTATATILRTMLHNVSEMHLLFPEAVYAEGEERSICCPIHLSHFCLWHLELYFCPKHMYVNGLANTPLKMPSSPHWLPCYAHLWQWKVPGRSLAVLQQPRMQQRRGIVFIDDRHLLEQMSHHKHGFEHWRVVCKKSPVDAKLNIIYDQ